MKVLPSRLNKEYQELLESNKFIKAESLKESISKQRFAFLINNDVISRDVSAFQLLRKEKIKEQSYYIIYRKYDSEQVDKAEDNNSTANIL